MKTESKKFPAVPVASWEKEQANHAPMPWQAINTEGAFSEIYIEQGDDGGWEPKSHPIATLTPASANDRPMCLANAQFICRAVNSHADLLEALRECITEDGALAWRNAEFAGRRLEAISNIARAAIQKAGGAL